MNHGWSFTVSINNLQFLLLWVLLCFCHFHENKLLQPLLLNLPFWDTSARSSGLLNMYSMCLRVWVLPQVWEHTVVARAGISHRLIVQCVLTTVVTAVVRGWTLWKWNVCLKLPYEAAFLNNPDNSCSLQTHLKQSCQGRKTELGKSTEAWRVNHEPCWYIHAANLKQKHSSRTFHPALAVSGLINMSVSDCPAEQRGACEKTEMNWKVNCKLCTMIRQR